MKSGEGEKMRNGNMECGKENGKGGWRIENGKGIGK